MRSRLVTPAWGRLTAICFSVCAAVALLAAPGLSSAWAQPKGKADKGGDKANTPATPAPAEPKAPVGKDKAPPKPKTFDFNALDLNGRMRSPQLLYFLERANEELERASLEKRSFIPHMVRSMEEEAL